MTYLDLHSHSVASDDSRATVEQYVKWVKVLRRKGHQINGFVLTEHRQFDAENDYSYMQAESDVQILKGSELDTDCGHFLVYGVGEALLKEVNFAEVGLNAPPLRKWAPAFLTFFAQLRINFSLSTILGPAKTGISLDPNSTPETVNLLLCCLFFLATKGNLVLISSILISFPGNLFAIAIVLNL